MPSAAGARAAVTFSSLYEEEPPSRGSARSPSGSRAIARDAGHRGVRRERHGVPEPGRPALRATGFATPDDMRAGPVTFLSHSGSAFAAIAFNDRGIGFNLIVSSGQEIVTTMADYMAYALGLETTRVLALLLETVRDPERFRAALAASRRARHPGGGAEGRSHRGVEGDGDRALGRARGRARRVRGAVRRVRRARGARRSTRWPTRSSCSPPAPACGRGRGIATRPRLGRGAGAVRRPGRRPRRAVRARSPTQTRAAIEDTLDPGLAADQPARRLGHRDRRRPDLPRVRSSRCTRTRTPRSLAFVVDLTRQGEPYDEGYLQVAKDVFAATTKPFCIVSNLASAVALEEAALPARCGHPGARGHARRGWWRCGHLLAAARRR